MRIKSDRTIPAARALALIMALLLALAALAISPGAARAEEPGAPDAAPSETPPEASAPPEPEPTPEEAKTGDSPAEAAAPLAAAPLSVPEAEDDAFTVTMVDGYPCVAGEVLVQFRRSASDARVQAALESVDAEDPEEIANNLHVVELPEGETITGYIEMLESQPDVLFAQPNYVYYLPETVVVPISGLPKDRSLMNTPEDENEDEFRFLQWHLDKIGVPEAWNTTMGDSGVRVAVLDTGADLDHPDLVDRIYAQADVVDNDGSAEDDYGHGTHVAGIIAATANNGIGVAGVAPGVSLIVVDVFDRDIRNPIDPDDDRFFATSEAIAAGIYYAIENDADVINLSLGGYQADAVETNAVNAAAAAGVVVVAAAGNDNTSATIYPGDLESVICVTATGPNDERAVYSNYGPAKDIAAPGGNGEDPFGWIASTFLNGSYVLMAGTSMAAPVVSGVAALMLSLNYNLTVDEIKSYLYSSAVDLGTPGKDDYFGHGRVSADAAIAAIPYIKSASYSIDRRKSILHNVPIGTSVSSLIVDLTANNGTVGIFASDQEVTSGNLATAMSVRLINGSTTEDELAIAVKGDVNGDGGLSIADYTLLRLYLLSKYSLSPAAAVAGDVTGDSALGIADYTDIRLALLKLKPLG